MLKPRVVIVACWVASSWYATCRFGTSQPRNITRRGGIYPATHEFVLGEFDTEQSGNSDEVWLGNAHEPRQGVEEVTEDELESEGTAISAFIDEE